MILVAIAAISLVISLSVFFTCLGGISQIYWIAVIFVGSFWGLLLLWMLPVIICSWFVDLKKPCRKYNPFFRFYADCLIDLAIRIARIKICVSGEEKLPNEKFLLVGNHLSYFDPGIAMMALRKYRMAFVGAMLGGLPFTMEGFNAGNLIGCLFTKIFLVLVFVAIFVVFSVVGKQRTWLSILLSIGVGVFMFMMIPMMTPLNANFIHVIMTLAGGAIFAVGLGALSNLILNKTSLV